MKLHINAKQLKIIAMVAMLLDHLWASVVPGNNWLTYLGRIAFPIFAFQLVEGYFHTKDLKKYFLRLLFFALISELPFDLMCESSLFYPFHQNTLFTLLLGLCAIYQCEKIKKNHAFISILGNGALLALVLLASALLFVDYGMMGIEMILLFYFFREGRFAKVGQFVGMLLINAIFFQGEFIPINILGNEIELMVQSFAILSLIPIWLYDGTSGKSTKTFRMICYLFYPCHLLALHGIASLLAYILG